MFIGSEKVLESPMKSIEVSKSLKMFKTFRRFKKIFFEKIIKYQKVPKHPPKGTIKLKRSINRLVDPKKTQKDPKFSKKGPKNPQKPAHANVRKRLSFATNKMKMDTLLD